MHWHLPALLALTVGVGIVDQVATAPTEPESITDSTAVVVGLRNEVSATFTLLLRFTDSTLVRVGEVPACALRVFVLPSMGLGPQSTIQLVLYRDHRTQNVTPELARYPHMPLVVLYTVSFNNLPRCETIHGTSRSTNSQS